MWYKALLGKRVRRILEKGRCVLRWARCSWPVALLAWNQVYEQVRPHQALGYKTSERFYQDWLNANTTGKEVLSHMS